MECPSCGTKHIFISTADGFVGRGTYIYECSNDACQAVWLISKREGLAKNFSVEYLKLSKLAVPSGISNGLFENQNSL